MTCTTPREGGGYRPLIGQCVPIGYTIQQMGCDLGPEWHKSVGVSIDMHVEYGFGHLALMPIL